MDMSDVNLVTLVISQSSRYFSKHTSGLGKVCPIILFNVIRDSIQH